MDQNMLREKINQYIADTDVKKKSIAAAINENPNNFSRWLTGKRNYGPERINQIIQFLYVRGYLYGIDEL